MSTIKDFEILKEVGKGAFGSVSLVKRKADSNIYAMKRVKISQLNPKEQENALNEVRILASISHPNIIGYKEAFFEEHTKTLNIVMEYADDGDLESKIQKHTKNKTNCPENEIWSYLIQMIQGLKALHDNKIMHRDLKSANVFLMKDGTLKLGDLNVSKVVKMGLVYTQTGTPYYASPEVWADKPYDYKSDIWSVGCVIYELCALRPPFKGTNLEQLFKAVSKGMF
jgi:NIMA (never in mitosis gene a)-related kinase